MDVNMKMTRRQLLKGAAIAGVGMALPLKFSVKEAHAFYQSRGLKRWKTALRGVGPGQIPVVATDGTAPVTGVKHYTIHLEEFTDTLHPNLGGPTTLWGFNPANPLGGGPQDQKHLGGIIVANKGEPIQITFKNMLPANNPIPIDTSLPGANQAQNRIAVHLHGGLIPWISDGGPFDWWTPGPTHGISFLNNVLNPGALDGDAEYYYGNNQSARLLWYHDHAFGITRINAYAGVASAYIIRDTFEAGLISNGLPEYIETSVTANPSRAPKELPIIIQDKIFVGNNIEKKDPTWVDLGLPSTPGSLWYPHLYEKNRWKLIGAGQRLPNPSVIAEMFGDTMLANGTVYPEITVEPTVYRLRILNACNARVLNLQLYEEDGTPDGISVTNGAATNPPGPDFLVLGTEGGFLPQPVVVPSGQHFDGIFGGSLITGPAERWDVLVDFTGLKGKNFIMYNDAPAPFPFGDDRNDYYFNNLLNPFASSTAGAGPDTRQIMRFKVRGTAAGVTLNIDDTTNLRDGNDPLLADQLHTTTTTNTYTVPSSGETVYLAEGVVVNKFRQLTLNEAFDAYGRLVQFIGTNVPLSTPGKFGRAYLDSPTEVVKNGDVEIWEVANLTGDTHPIHIHLINGQILYRQPFDSAGYNGTPTFTDPPILPDGTELGWKETFKMHPDQVIYLIMKFELPLITGPGPSYNLVELGAGPGISPPSPRMAAQGIPNGNEYVYHCHILEHEEHDMMRPLIVVP